MSEDENSTDISEQKPVEYVNSMSVPAFWITGMSVNIDEAVVRIAFNERSHVRTAIIMNKGMTVDFARALMINLLGLEDFGEEFDNAVTNVLKLSRDSSEEDGASNE
ncbi:MAG: hypothetical protein OXR64_02895 [Chloroflexota bacterium]|nr:hypothetical protein [Chloroflexota bacterium]